MPRKSAISQMPDEIREAVDAAIREGRATITEITEMIRNMGGQISRAAVGNYVKKANDAMERYRQARIIAEQWTDVLPENGDVAQVARQSITASALFAANMLNGEAEIDTKSLAQLARTLKDVAASAKIDAEARQKIREELKEELAGELAEQVENEAGPISPERLRALIRESYGV